MVNYFKCHEFKDQQLCKYYDTSLGLVKELAKKLEKVGGSVL